MGVCRGRFVTCGREERKNVKLSAQEATDGKAGAGLDFTSPEVSKL